MPSFNIDMDWDFEVWCKTCGHGLCNVTDVNRNQKGIEVEVCPSCMKEKDNEIENLNSEIDDLNDCIENLEEEVKRLKDEIKC